MHNALKKFCRVLDSTLYTFTYNVNSLVEKGNTVSQTYKRAKGYYVMKTITRGRNNYKKKHFPLHKTFTKNARPLTIPIYNT